MFPLRDDTPALSTPFAVIFLIALNAAIWVAAQGMGSEPMLTRSICHLGLIPGELLGRLPPRTPLNIGPDLPCLTGSPNWLTPLTSMFLHGSWFHIVGNMWFLWVFGNNIEDDLGHDRFIVFYLLCGLVAAALQTFIHPASKLPMVGASGAIGGVMGAYAVRYPQARVLTLIFLGFFVRTVWVPARLMLGYWFLLQVVGALPALRNEGGGVAFWAHIGGFAAGIALFYVMRPRSRALPHDEHLTLP